MLHFVFSFTNLIFSSSNLVFTLSNFVFSFVKLLFKAFLCWSVCPKRYMASTWGSIHSSLSRAFMEFLFETLLFRPACFKWNVASARCWVHTDFIGLSNFLFRSFYVCRHICFTFVFILSHFGDIISLKRSHKLRSISRK